MRMQGSHQMRRSGRWIAAILVTAGLGLLGCTASASTESGEPPAKVEGVAGMEVKRVTLTQKASERLAIETVQSRPLHGTPNVAGAQSRSRTVVPYDAVIYDVKGDTWVYTMPQPLTYVRQRVTIDRVEARDAVLSQGPAPGTAVVMRGAAELYGTELGVGK
jgi:hypothetical protein